MNGMAKRSFWIALLVTSLGASLGCKSGGEPTDTPGVKEAGSMAATYRLVTDRSVEEVGKDFDGACKKHKFGVLGVYNLQEKMQEKGVEFDKECLIMEICNPGKAKEVLDSSMEISAALPCRVSIYSEGGRTYLATIPPERMLEMFQAEGLALVAAEVQETIYAIMREAAGPGAEVVRRGSGDSETSPVEEAIEDAGETARSGAEKVVEELKKSADSSEWKQEWKDPE